MCQLVCFGFFELNSLSLTILIQFLGSNLCLPSWRRGLRLKLCCETVLGSLPPLVWTDWSHGQVSIRVILFEKKPNSSLSSMMWFSSIDLLELKLFEPYNLLTISLRTNFNRNHSKFAQAAPLYKVPDTTALWHWRPEERHCRFA
jgi:hypothetical protein